MDAVMDLDRPDLGTLAAVIARSSIVLAREPVAALPAGFDDIEIAILDWIASEGRRAGYSFVRM